MKTFLIYFIGIILTYFVLMILSYTVLLLREKRNEIFIRNKNNIDTYVSFSDNIDTTISFMSLCTSLIDNEVGKLISTYLQSNKKYEYLKVDEDVRTISDNVYSAFKENIINNDELIISSEFIMKFIIEETLNRLLTLAKEYNSSLSQ